MFHILNNSNLNCISKYFLILVKEGTKKIKNYERGKDSISFDLWKRRRSAIPIDPARRDRGIDTSSWRARRR